MKCEVCGNHSSVVHIHTYLLCGGVGSKKSNTGSNNFKCAHTWRAHMSLDYFWLLLIAAPVTVLIDNSNVSFMSLCKSVNSFLQIEMNVKLRSNVTC